MENKLLIVGASGHGKVIADIAIKMNSWDEVSFLDDDREKEHSMGLKVIGQARDALKFKDDYEFIIGVGDNTIRKNIQKQLEQKGASMATLIHPSSVIGSGVQIGRGTVIMANAVINCCTNVGRGCIVNTSATVDHDNKIEDYVHISPGAHTAGTVHIGKASWLGIGSVVSNNISIANNCIIGGGAVVVKNISEAGVYIGIPARRI